MPSITVKNIPDEIYSAVKKSAEQNMRSINSEIIFQLRMNNLCHSVNPDEILNEIKTFNKENKMAKLGEDTIKKAKSAGQK